MIEAEKSQRVTVGTHVEVELIDEAGECERLEFDLVPEKQADFTNGFLGESTPLAQAILGQTAGSVVAYRVGDVAKVSILTVTPDARVPVEDVAAKRQAVVQQVVAESNRISDMVFALAVGSKWGDYDPSGSKD
jgi:hypothetical protein